AEGRGTDRYRERRRTVRRRGRRGGSRLGVARLEFPCADERQGAARLVLWHGLSFAGFLRPAAAQIVVRTPGAQSRLPCCAVDCARGRRRGAGRGGGRGG